MTLAWHFLYPGHQLRDGTVAPPDGEWLEVDGPILLCERGLHASLDPFDALKHAPGPILCRVECDGGIVHADDKLVCRRRRILRRMDATDMLRYFARMQAVSALHLWQPEPPDVVLDWLMTGDDSLRSAAESAAWSAAELAVWVAGWSAAGPAARSAAWSAAGSAAWLAAWLAAWSAAEPAAWSAAWSAARSAARLEFNALVNECFDITEAA